MLQQTMLRKIVWYGLAGWVVEVIFTGTVSLLKRDKSATAQTYLWMFPIYGGFGALLDVLSRRLKQRWPAPAPLRALTYVPFIYAAEMSSGWVLSRVLGKCPWDYGKAGLNSFGLVRWDYAPAWYLAALAFEPLSDGIESAERKLFSTQPPTT